MIEKIKAALQDGKIMVVVKFPFRDQYKLLDGVLCNALCQASDGSERWSPVPDKDSVIEHIGMLRGFYKDASIVFVQP